MRLMHTMIRVKDLDESLKFYCDALGMKLLRRNEYPSGKFTLAFVGYGEVKDSAVVELTYNWGKRDYQLGDAFGHLAIGVSDIYEYCNRLKEHGVKVVREPGPMAHSSASGGGGSVIAFIEDPNGYRIELIQEAAAAPKTA